MAQGKRFFIGHLRTEKEIVAITDCDGNTHTLLAESNPIDSGSRGVSFNGHRLSKQERNHLYERDINRPWITAGYSA